MAQTVYIRFTSVSKLLEIAVCFAHFDFFEITTPVMRSMLAIANVVTTHHFRHGAHSVYRIYSVSKLLEIAVCFAHFDFFEITTPVMRIMLAITNIV